MKLPGSEIDSKRRYGGDYAVGSQVLKARHVDYSLLLRFPRRELVGSHSQIWSSHVPNLVVPQPEDLVLCRLPSEDDGGWLEAMVREVTQAKDACG